jgi:hypothetical protein
LNIIINDAIEESFINTIFSTEVLSICNFNGRSSASSVKWKPSQSSISIKSLTIDKVQITLIVSSPNAFSLNVRDVLFQNGSYVTSESGGLKAVQSSNSFTVNGYESLSSISVFKDLTCEVTFNIPSISKIKVKDSHVYKISSESSAQYFSISEKLSFYRHININLSSFSLEECKVYVSSNIARNANSAGILLLPSSSFNIKVEGSPEGYHGNIYVKDPPSGFGSAIISPEPNNIVFRYDP